MALPLLGDNVALLLVIAGAALIIGEALAPGAHFIVIGVALLVAGLVGLFLPASLGPVVTTMVLAALVVVVGGASLYVYRQFDFYGGKGTDQTSDSESLRGATGRVTERVTDSGGEVKLDDGGFNPYYRARSMDDEIEEGTRIVVVEPGGGNVLTVQSLDTDDIDRELARARAAREAAGSPDSREDAERNTDEDSERDTDAEPA
ncbi:MAG: NfeD family protein [Haloarculaceae archaeon]